MGLACTKGPKRGSKPTVKRWVDAAPEDLALAQRGRSSKLGKGKPKRRKQTSVFLSLQRTFSKHSMVHQGEDKASTLVSYLSETEDELFDEDEEIIRCQYENDLNQLGACLRSWLCKSGLVDCAPHLVSGGVQTLEDLKGSRHSFLEKHGLPSQRAKVLMRAARRAPRASSTLAYLELLSDTEWLDQMGMHLCVVEPSHLRGEKVPLQFGASEKAYKKPKFKSVSNNKGPGYVEPIRACETVGKQAFLQTCEDALQLGDIAMEHVMLSVTENLSLRQWSKDRISIKNLDQSVTTKVFVSLGDSILVKELRGNDECSLDISISSNVHPIGMQIGDFLVAFTGSGIEYPEGPSHHGDNGTLMVFPQAEDVARELLQEQGFQSVCQAHYRSSMQSTDSKNSTISQWGEVFANNLRRFSVSD